MPWGVVPRETTRMSIRTARWPAGVPCWVDLTTPDVSAATAFYRDVVGWDVEDGGNEYDGYLTAHRDGAAAAGIGPLPEGVRPAWTLYFASDDADGTAAAVTAAGGEVLLPPGDVGPLGRMFIATDPTGAVFGVWQAGNHIGASLVNEPGGLVWEDLRSPDPDTARAFYAIVFGHVMDALPMAGTDYATFRHPDEEAPLGGMGGLMGSERSQWLAYFCVPDAAVAVAVAAAQRAGGKVLGTDYGTPFGDMAHLADPAGAEFLVLAARDGQPQPDRSD